MFTKFHCDQHPTSSCAGDHKGARSLILINHQIPGFELPNIVRSDERSEERWLNHLMYRIQTTVSYKKIELSKWINSQIRRRRGSSKTSLTVESTLCFLMLWQSTVLGSVAWLRILNETVTTKRCPVACDSLIRSTNETTKTFFSSAMNFCHNRG